MLFPPMTNLHLPNETDSYLFSNNHFLGLCLFFFLASLQRQNSLVHKGTSEIRNMQPGPKAGNNTTNTPLLKTGTSGSICFGFLLKFSVMISQFQ